MNIMGNEPQSFAEVQERLDDIIVQVRRKDLSLEKSLDLYEEAIRLGNNALNSLNKPEFSPEEEAMLIELQARASQPESNGTSDNAAADKAPDAVAGEAPDTAVGEAPDSADTIASGSSSEAIKG